MKKIILFAVLILSCNSALLSQQNDTLTISNLQEQINVLKAENAQMKAEISNLKDILLKVMSGSQITVPSVEKQTETEPDQTIQPKENGDYGQCKATTKSGSRCKRKAGASGYCWQHER